MFFKVPNNEFFKCVLESIQAGESVKIRVKGNSMYPFLKEGNAILLSPFEAKELKPESIVLFAYRDIYILHRIIARKDDRLIIQGDNVYTHVEKATISHVVALVKQVHYDNGRIVKLHSMAWKFAYMRNRIKKKIKRMIIPTMKKLNVFKS